MKNKIIDNSFGSFVVIENDKNDKNNNNKNNINLFNSDSSTAESIYIPLSKKIKEIPYKDNSKKFLDHKRSESVDENASISIEKKKTEFFDLDEILNENNKIEEIKPFKLRCILYDKKNNIFDGNLIIDKNYIFYFIPDKNTNKNKTKNNLLELYYNSDYYKFSLLYIKSINQNTNLLGQITYFVEIILKDCRSFLFKFDMISYDFFIKTISKYVKPDKNSVFFEKAFNFKNTNNNNNKNNQNNFWDIYDIEKEFNRQGVDIKSNKSKYYLLDNSSFSICESYPKKLIVPNLNTKNIIQDIKICADFRTKKRLPVLTYKHKNGICIWRCSQTKNGFNGKNEKDILLLTKIADDNKLIIYDCRPKLNAWVNKLKGAGYENKGHYNKINMEIKFCDIPNIHSVRSSFESVFTNVSYSSGNNPQSSNYDIYSNLADTLWYDSIILILKSSFDVYESIVKEKNTVLIHCSDGWDRTSQLSSISQILLDKYYRTLKGFIVLIEKDWMSFGHQFRYRNGFYSNKDTPANICKENQFSPIFIQWLDCIYQLMQQNLDKFEFNENLLTFIAEQIYEGKYGNFLFNNEKERQEFNMKEKTENIWSYVLENKKKFMNPIFNKKLDDNTVFEINYKKIKLWEDYFFRFEKGEKKGKYINLINDKFMKYKNKIKKQQKIIEEMYKIIEAKDKKLITPELKKELGIKEEEKKEPIKKEKDDFSFVVLDKDDFDLPKK